MVNCKGCHPDASNLNLAMLRRELDEVQLVTQLTAGEARWQAEIDPLIEAMPQAYWTSNSEWACAFPKKMSLMARRGAPPK